jgi:hypothetical protein
MQAGGTYYLKLALEEGDETEEFPIELVVDVTGEAVEATPTADRSPTDDDDPGQAAPPDDTSSSSNTAMLAVGGIAFGLLGAALGALAGRRVTGNR